MAEQVKKYRDPVFDMMKGIGILLVLWGHAPGISSLTDTFISSFHMPLFFILSGYFCQTTIDYSNWKNVLEKNFQRLVIPYLLTLCLIAAWFTIFAITRHDYSGLQLVVRKLIGKDNWTAEIGWMPIWFLMALFWAKMLFYFISRMRPWVVMVVCTLISLLAVLLRMHFDFGMPFHFLRGCQALVFIAIGWWVRDNKLPIWIYLLCVACWLVQLANGASMTMFSIEYSCWPLNILAAVGGVWCLYLLCRKIHKVCEYKYFRFTQSILLWLGVCSLAIMCLHDIELNCSFIRIPMHRVPMIETYCGTLVRYIITIALVWFLSKWSWFRKIFIG